MGKLLTDLALVEPRKSVFEFNDMYRRLSSINVKGSNIKDFHAEAILCLMNEIEQLKKEVEILKGYNGSTIWK